MRPHILGAEVYRLFAHILEWSAACRGELEALALRPRRDVRLKAFRPTTRPCAGVESHLDGPGPAESQTSDSHCADRPHGASLHRRIQNVFCAPARRAWWTWPMSLGVCPVADASLVAQAGNFWRRRMKFSAAYALVHKVLSLARKEAPEDFHPQHGGK